MPRYTFTFKKDDVSLEYVTTDKESMERQFQIWVTCASVWAYNQEKIEKGLMPKPMPTAPKVESPKEEPVQSEQQEPKQETQTVVDIIGVDENPNPENVVDADFRIEAQNEIDRESQRIIQEYKAEMEAEERRKENEQKAEVFKKDVEKIVRKEEAVQKELKNLYEQKQETTLNDIAETQPKEEEKVSDLAADFDSLLQRTMQKPVLDVKEKQDDRFLKVMKLKNVSEKLDLLIVTAYYLSEFERLDRFTLKLVNAKLMENLHENVDNAVLQDAIDKGFVECIPNYTGIASAMEYRLTESGEEVFYNKK